jgi:hypothetical protein
MWIRTTALLLALMPARAMAEERPVTITVVNATAAPLECQAEAAHWYAFDLGIAQLNESLSIALLFEATTGTVGKPSHDGGMLPIETVYCGRAGRAYETRFVLPLRTLAARGAATVRCHAGRDAVVCEGK